jgi:ABC-type dipeptide/oligopeptide/nickel transport system permease component
MMRMVALRLALTLPILLGVSMVAFALMRALPGDFAQASAGTTMISAEALDQIRRNLGLDRPIWAQYLAWLGNALQGDLGLSFATRRPVLGELVPRFLVTAELTLIAGLMALTLGTCTGLASARLRGRVDWIVRGWNSLLLAVPNFVVATLIVLLAGLYFPTIGIFTYVPFAEDPVANVVSLLLPALSLALTVSVTISENTRAAVLDRQRSAARLPRAQCPHARDNGDRTADGGSPGWFDPDRDDLHDPRHGPVPVRVGDHARLSGDPGHRPRRRERGPARERGRGHRLCPCRRAGVL